VRWVRWVEPSAIPAILSEHRFYLQLSATEGFPNALAEAMLCACVPIGSAVAAIPLMIGQTGYVLPKKDLHALVSLLKTAEADYLPAKGVGARERIQTYFPLAEREKRLLALCEAVAEKRLPTVEDWEAGLLLPDSTQ
jgi:glycosyltransferase involved in cell wall biosynthesis